MYAWYIHRGLPALAWLRSRFAGRTKVWQRKPRAAPGAQYAPCGDGSPCCNARLRQVRLQAGACCKRERVASGSVAHVNPRPALDAMQSRQRLSRSVHCEPKMALRRSGTG
ncbi:hypothetical protein TP47_08345 [Xanthomonas citri pv. aurantifolii]|nr:hypothetical protein TP37_03720 [Xanthomonas citri pv. aurantifolii]EFF47462.1 conserved hypothetical protein [Xanthomonas citri pv. aurantifolii str. ICPB 10535]TBW98537.1 hypothetical protein TP47_08345 [Xanthomonas citri pv. aurantifolii]